MTVRELCDLLALVDQDMRVTLFDSSMSDLEQRIGAVVVRAGQVVILSD
jgi:hypothetical protein